MRFIQAFSFLVTLSEVSSFVPQFSNRKIPVVATAAKRRPWKGFLEKQGDGNDSQVLVEEANGKIEIEHVEEKIVTVAGDEEENEVPDVVKDEQTLFDEMNMQKAIQLVIDWYVNLKIGDHVLFFIMFLSCT